MTTQIERPMDIKYWDANKDAYVSHQGWLVRSGAGWGPGPEYRVIYRLTDGRYLHGTRHTDRGDLMTDITYTVTP